MVQDTCYRKMSLGLPPELSSYAAIINLALLFVDGLLFGLALKKGLTSAMLLLVAFALTAYVGLSIPYLSSADILTHLFNIILSLSNHLGALFVTFPVFFILGIAIGFWRG